MASMAAPAISAALSRRKRATPSGDEAAATGARKTEPGEAGSISSTEPTTARAAACDQAHSPTRGSFRARLAFRVTAEVRHKMRPPLTVNSSGVRWGPALARTAT